MTSGHDRRIRGGQMSEARWTAVLCSDCLSCHDAVSNQEKVTDRDDLFRGHEKDFTVAYLDIAFLPRLNWPGSRSL